MRNEGGKPIAGAYVKADSMPHQRQFVFESARRPTQTDEEGAFRLEGVAPEAVRLSVYAKGYQRYRLRDLKVPPRGEASGLESVLVRGATVVGTVTRPDGTPVAQASVVLSDFGYGDETDGTGRYQIEGVAPVPG